MKVVDLFCGVGGLSKGLESAGMDVVAGYDNWSMAVDVYNRNLRHSAKVFDLLDVDKAIWDILPYKPDLIAGGPPCQDFSTAGRRVECNNAKLTLAYAKIVSIIHPPIALMENVPQVRLSSVYKKAKDNLQNEGYNFYECVLDASHCGVPQKRKRFFMVAFLGAKNTGERIATWMRENMDEKSLTVKEYLQDEIDLEHYYRHPRNYSRRAVFSVHEPSPTIRGVNRPVPPGYRTHRLDTAPPSDVRPLTSLERSRIQTFPSSWEWKVDGSKRISKTDVEHLIGNAVPMDLAKFVGKGLLSAV